MPGDRRPMSSGFNTDVKVGENVFHVQTEDRGESHPIIDTAVYQNGRILHRRVFNYAGLTVSSSFTSEDLRGRVEDQHRAVIEDVRSGALDSEIASASLATQNSRPKGIQLQLLNLSSWVSGGKVSLDVEVSRRSDRQPQVGAKVEARIEGALEDTRYSALSDEQGRARIQFPMPPLGKGDLALEIQAKADAWKDEIRFTMRSRAKGSPESQTP